MFFFELREHQTVSLRSWPNLEVHILGSLPPTYTISSFGMFSIWCVKLKVQKQKVKTRKTSVPIYVCFYLTMHAGHDPIHIEEYRFVFASKYSLT